MSPNATKNEQMNKNSPKTLVSAFSEYFSMKRSPTIDNQSLWFKSTKENPFSPMVWFE